MCISTGRSSAGKELTSSVLMRVLMFPISASATPGAVEALELLVDMRKSGMNPEGSDHNVVTSLFLEGKVAAVIDGSWSLTGFRDAGVNYGVAKIPPYADGSELRPLVSACPASRFRLSAKTRNWRQSSSNTSSYDVLLAIYEETADLPPRPDVASHPAVAEHPDASVLVARPRWEHPPRTCLK